jgi:hypothetical protein
MLTVKERPRQTCEMTGAVDDKSAIPAIETIAKLCGLWKEKPGAQNQFNGPVTFEVHYTRESVSNEPHPHTIELQGSSAV